MNMILQAIQTLTDFFPILFLSALIFLICYGIVRVLRLPEAWIIGGIGFLLLLFVLYRVAPPILRQPAQFPSNMAALGSMLGLVAVVSAFYAFGQWTMRWWYRVTKQRIGSFVRRSSGHILRFLRLSHRFFGWAVLVAATAHLFLYIPLLAKMPWKIALLQPAVVTGIIAWLVLAFLVGLGLWVEVAVKMKRFARWIRLVHFSASFGFFLFTLIHIATKLQMH